MGKNFKKGGRGGGRREEQDKQVRHPWNHTKWEGGIVRCSLHGERGGE